MHADTPWAPLVKLLVEEADPASLADRLRALSDDLERLGVSGSVLEANCSAIETNQWEPFIEAYAADVDASAVCVCAPLRAREQRLPKPGVTVLRRPERSVIADATDRAHLLDVVGESLFGDPLTIAGRIIEFYHHEISVGGFSDPADPPIALFTPFNFGGWTPEGLSRNCRRTQLLTNVVADRFIAQTNTAAHAALRLDGGEPGQHFVSAEVVDDSIETWLFLHEAMHLNGPIPLFGGVMSKIGLGERYAPIEEFRVDASIFLGLSAAAHRLGSIARSTGDLILMERVLRSALVAPPRPPPHSSASEFRHGRIWLNALIYSGALAISDSGGIDISREHAVRAIGSALEALYNCEERVVSIDDGELRRAALRAEYDRWMARIPAANDSLVTQAIARCRAQQPV